MLKTFFLLIIKSIRSEPLRSWLTIAGVVIGVMLVVIIFSLGSGIQNVLRERLQMFGSDFIVVIPGKATNPLAGLVGGQRFRERDIMDLENISGVKFVVPRNILMVNVEYRGEKKSALLHAAPWRGMIQIFEESQGVRLTEGRWPETDLSREVVLGSRFARLFFQREVHAGDEILIRSKRVTVSGILSPIGEQMVDNMIFLSLDLFRQITGQTTGVRAAFLKVLPDADINIVSKKIESALSKQEVIRDFSVLTPEKAVRGIGRALSIVELVFLGIAFISLLVGLVNIMNTMYTAVLERTKEIGILKAIGATNEAILSLFLMESGIIGLIGGIIGIVFGIFAAYLVSLAASRYGIVGLFSLSSLDYSGFLVVLIVTFLTGIFAGVLPARQASRLEPAEALRSS